MLKDYQKMLAKFCEKNPQKSKKEVYDHFKAYGLAKSTIYRWHKQLEEGSFLNRRKSSGRPVKIATREVIKQLVRNFDHRAGCSQRKMARRIGCTQQYISFLLKQRTMIRRRKRIKRPLMTEKQKQKARRNCRHMLSTYKKIDFVMDDESYFTLTQSNLPGNDSYYTSNNQLTPHHVQHYYKAKHEEKLLVYLVISPKGVSKPRFIPSGLAVNRWVYVGRCIRPVLRPFLKKHYPNGGYVFWPDLATAHYANFTIGELQANGIPFVPKWSNPANVPKARPIEDFWGILKEMVYERDWSAQTLDELKNRIIYCMKKIDPSLVQRLMGTVRQRLRQIARNVDV